MKLVVLGGGISGRAAVRLAEIRGDFATIVNDSETLELPEADQYIVSPGVHPLRSGLYSQAVERGRPMLSELEFGFENLGGIPVLAVTGTNGKTTTTELTTHLLRRAGLRTAFAGNIGVPLSEIAAAEALKSPSERLEAIVVEVSSFQLELCRDFAPLAAVLLNLESDHVDRYRGGFAEYCAVKRSIFNRVVSGNRIWGLSFSDAGRRVMAVGRQLVLDGRAIIDLDSTRLAAPHNVENLAAAVELALRIVPADWFYSEKFRAAARDFSPGAHRCEVVGSRSGVVYVNDSKATNPAAVLAAVRTFSSPVVLLLGGLDKGMDFSPLKSIVPQLKAAVCYGQCRDKIAGVLAAAGMTPVNCGMDFSAAFEAARRLAGPGDTVLLSPACASFDLFTGYEARGNRFRELVAALPE